VIRFAEITCTVKNGSQFVYVNGCRFRATKPGKTEALIFGLSKLDLKEYDVILLIDDDIRVQGDVYKFIQRFYDPKLGVLCGNREFTNTSTVASAARHLWGLHARPVMRLAEIPCGAFMAIRTQLIPDFLALWANTVFDDTAAARIAKSRGYEFRYDKYFEKMRDPSTITWPLFWQFVVRQYADVRSIGPWKSLLCAWALALVVSAIPYMVLGPSAFLLYPLGLLYPGTRRNWRVLLAMPLAQLSFILGVPYAALAKKIKWKHRTVDLATQRFV
jgi:hypothetical protein